jgi:hypothetical protein
MQLSLVPLGVVMRATIKIVELDHGIIRKKLRWKVECKIDFTGEELAIIRARDLGDLQVYMQSNSYGAEPFQVNLKEVVKVGIWSVFISPVDARNFEQQLTTKTLPALKNYLMASAEIETSPRILEF